MTDVLAERFSALADATDDSDWLEVRRRARRGRRSALPTAALAAAALVAATAVAAGGGWLFTGHRNGATATRTISFHGTTYTLTVDTFADGALCMSLGKLHGPRLAHPCVVPVLSDSPLKRALTTWLPVGHLVAEVRGGEVAFGAARPDIARVAVTNAAGKTFTTPTSAGPASLKPRLRFWAMAFPGRARRLTAFNAAGKVVVRTRLDRLPLPVTYR